MLQLFAATIFFASLPGLTYSHDRKIRVRKYASVEYPVEFVLSRQAVDVFNNQNLLCMEILVFKTDACNKGRVNALAPHLENMKGIIKWNVDLQDVDKVLRIECASVSAAAIEKSLQQAGFYCKELQG